jgi:hypothetical protein
MARKIGRGASNVQYGNTSASVRAEVGSRVYDTVGNEYLYVGASGVAVGAPVKAGASLALCVTGTAEGSTLGVATQAFASTGFSYGLVGVRGTHPTRVPSGTAAGSLMVGGSGTTKATTGIPSRSCVTLAAAQDDGSVIDAYWF